MDIITVNSWVSLCKYAVNLSGGQPGVEKIFYFLGPQGKIENFLQNNQVNLHLDTLTV